MNPFLTCSPLPHPLHRNAIRSPHRQPRRRGIWAIYAALKPSKDFANSQILHWSSMELLELAAVRFATFLRRRNVALYERLIDHMNFHDRRAIREFWLRFVPPHVISQTGLQEDTLAYIMRHTQLLPRHIIKYAGEIFAGKLTT